MAPDHLLRQVHVQPVLAALDVTEVAWLLQWTVVRHSWRTAPLLKYPTATWSHAAPVAPVAHVLHVAPTQKLAQTHMHTPFEMDANVAWPLQYPAAVHSEHVG